MKLSNGTGADAKLVVGVSYGEDMHRVFLKNAAGGTLCSASHVLGHSQLSTTTRYAHHAPQRPVATASAAIVAWDLLPAPAAIEADAVAE